MAMHTINDNSASDVACMLEHDGIMRWCWYTLLCRAGFAGVEVWSKFHAHVRILDDANEKGSDYEVCRYMVVAEEA